MTRLFVPRGQHKLNIFAFRVLGEHMAGQIILRRSLLDVYECAGFRIIEAG